MSDLKTRTELLRQIEEGRGSKVVLYATGDRRGLETRIGQDVIDLFVDHLDEIGPVPKISLVLYTSGGSTSAAWNLVNLIRMFCDDFEVIAPGKCMSAGTIICLGADRIVMTKQATLGPIDPTLHHSLGPPIPGANPDARVGVSVEEVNGYLDAIRACNGGADYEGKALLDLSNKVHPLVLGQIFVPGSRYGTSRIACSKIGSTRAKLAESSSFFVPNRAVTTTRSIVGRRPR